MYIRSPYPAVPELPTTNCHNLMFRTPEQLAFSDYVMYIDAVTGQQQTRYDFVERMYDLATALGASTQKGGLGLGDGKVVGVLSDNCIDYCTLLQALMVITTPYALYSSYATAFELKHYLNKSKPSHIFVHPVYLSKLLSVAHEEGFPLSNILLLDGNTGTASNGHPTNLCTLEDLIRMVRVKRIPREPVRHVQMDTLAYLVFSSGTSGFPKAVMISHSNLAFSFAQNAVVFSETNRESLHDPNAPLVTLAYLPIFHTYGLHAVCLRAPMRRTTVVLMPRWNIDLALQSIEKYRVTNLPLIPSVVHALVTSGRLRTVNHSSVTAIQCGAAHLPPTLAERLKADMPQAAFAEGYGMSEATISIITQTGSGVLASSIETGPTAAGVLVPGLEALVLRPDGTHTLPGEAGELYVKGKNVALGYYKDSGATKEAFIPDGWLKTGDIFRVNIKGIFYFEDRAKDTLKVSGMQVSPAEIEATIMAEPEGVVQDVAVAGVHLPTARTTDDKTPRAWVVLTEKGKRLTSEEARWKVEDWVQKNLSRYKWLRGGVEFVDEIPKNPSGKTLRRLLTERYGARLVSRPKL